MFYNILTGHSFTIMFSDLKDCCNHTADKLIYLTYSILTICYKINIS